MGLGGFPAVLADATGAKVMNPLWLGMLGMHGTFRANMAISNADVLFAVGARFDDRVTGKISGFAPKAKIIHIDVDPHQHQQNVMVDIPIVGDCKDALQQDPANGAGQSHRGPGGKTP